MNENEMTDKLADCILDDASILCDRVSSCRTFKDLGLLTNNNGLVIRLDDGSEFQITVVRSR